MSATIAAIPEISLGGVIERLPVAFKKITIFKPEDLWSDDFVVPVGIR